MKRALVLSGGGSKGAFEVGAIEYLVREASLDFDVFLGTSVGALNAAVLSQAWDYQELLKQTSILKKLWLQIKGNHSIYNQSVLGVFKLLFSDAIYNPSGLRRLIREYVDPGRFLSHRAKILKVTTVAKETGELLYADSRRPELQANLLDYILASASIPLFFPAVTINNKHWYDGGLRDVTPLGAVFREDPDEIIVILTFPIDSNLNPVLYGKSHHGALGMILRTIEIMSNEICANDIQLANLNNRNHRNFPGRQYVPIKIITPEKPLTGSHFLDFKPDAIRENLKQGFIAAQNPKMLCKKSLSQTI